MAHPRLCLQRLTRFPFCYYMTAGAQIFRNLGPNGDTPMRQAAIRFQMTAPAHADIPIWKPSVNWLRVTLAL